MTVFYVSIDGFNGSDQDRYFDYSIGQYTTSKSLVLPTGTDAGFFPQTFTLTTDSARATGSVLDVLQSTLAQTTLQSGWMGKVFSNQLAAQTITAQNWTVTFGFSEENAQANAFAALSIIVWNPNTDTVRGRIYDNAAALGAEWPTAFGTRSFTVAGSAVTCQDGDIIVVEIWFRATQGKAVSYLLAVNTTASTATQVSCPQNLLFYKRKRRISVT